MDHSMANHCIEGLEKSKKSADKQTVLQIKALVSELRTKILDSYEKSPEDYDPIDMETIKWKDYPIKRFLTYNNLNAKQAFSQLTEAMKWRKTFGIQRDYSRCGIEMFQSGAMFIHEVDLEGRPVLYARVKTHVRVAELERVVQDILVTTLELLDQLAEDRGYTVVMDMSGAGLSNVDLKIVRFMATLFTKYFPDSLANILVVDLPFYLKTFMPIVRLILGAKYSEMIHTVNRQELLNFIDRDNVPKYLGGNSTHDFTQPPEECKLKSEELAHLYDMSPTVVRKSIKKLDIHMSEAKELVRFSNGLNNNQ